MLNSVVAIDGPSASGKSSVSREAARQLGWIYVDSGALYRGVTWQLQRMGCDTNDVPTVCRLLPDIKFEFTLKNNVVNFTVNGEDPGQALRSAAVRDQVSPVAAVPEVRALVVDLLRGLLRLGCLVMEGRDIGTVVFPRALVKIFLDADPAERARRRHSEIVTQAEAVDLAAVGDALRRRDALDSSRTVAPLRVAGDALVLDTTAMTMD
ncbi:MAG: (d)CMP kinase, partial [Lentisphaerae bacterium]|nr:(d)CMP kinase [Lentisphaerota bacterium]